MFSKKKKEQRLPATLMEIKENILLARQFIGDLGFESFVVNKEKMYAVIRSLEIISEASRRLPEEILKRHSHIPWQDIATAGNFYRHEYQRLHDREIWRTVHEDLPVFLAVVEIELDRLKKP